MVEARGVLIATVLAALVLISLLGMAVYRYAPQTIRSPGPRPTRPPPDASASAAAAPPGAAGGPAPPRGPR